MLEVASTARWGQRTRSKFPQASGSRLLREALAVGTAFAALLWSLNLCCLDFRMENYASAAVEMQMFGNKIHGLKQTVDRMRISTGLSCPGQEARLRGGRERPGAHLNS